MCLFFDTTSRLFFYAFREFAEQMILFTFACRKRNEEMLSLSVIVIWNRVLVVVFSFTSSLVPFKWNAPRNTFLCSFIFPNLRIPLHSRCFAIRAFFQITKTDGAKRCWAKKTGLMFPHRYGYNRYNQHLKIKHLTWNCWEKATQKRDDIMLEWKHDAWCWTISFSIYVRCIPIVWMLIRNACSDFLKPKWRNERKKM